MEYTSFEIVPSAVIKGVTFTIAKMSFARRLELTQQLRDLATRREFVAAGDTANEKMEAAILGCEIDKIYLSWGLAEVSGLNLDGQPATPESLAARGPESLFREALAAVKHECGLTEIERKN